MIFRLNLKSDAVPTIQLEGVPASDSQPDMSEKERRAVIRDLFKPVSVVLDN
jgi:hypothetical protein